MKFTLGSILAVSMANAYSTRLEDCKAFATLFSGTCGGVDNNSSENFQYTATDWATSVTGSAITCGA